MNRGIYISTSGMMTSEKILKDIANNVANYSTTGYKRDLSTTSQFSDRLQSKIDDNMQVGVLKNQHVVEDTETVFSEGPLVKVESRTAFAIKGEGFFKLLKNNEYLYTRNGDFQKDSEGYLVTKDGSYVLNKNNARLRADADIAKEINIVDFPDKKLLVKTGDNNFINSSAANAEVQAQGNVEEGFLESSNVDLSDELTNLIKTQRQFSFNQRSLRTNDELLERLVNFN